MPIIAFLNELSHREDDHTNSTSKEKMVELAKVLMKIKKTPSGLVLCSAEKIQDIGLENGRSLSSLRKDPKYIDLWRLIATIQNQSPFIIEPLSLESDYFFGSKRAVGLGIAYHLDTIALSFGGSDWSDSPINARLESIIEADEETTIHEETVQVRHASSEGHITALSDWLKSIKSPTPHDGDELWQNREAELPNLKFLARTENQIRSLKHGSIELYAVDKKLKEINTSMSEWVPDESESPTFKSRMSPEYTNRKELCRFTDLDGVEKTFDYHGRYTPCEGRIHFRYDRNTLTATIAHVGEKL